MTQIRRGMRAAAWGAATTLALSALTVAAPAAATTASTTTTTATTTATTTTATTASTTTTTATVPGAPGGLSPNTTAAVVKNLELRWAAVAGATSYDVQLLDDDDADLARVQSANTPFTRWTVPVQLPTGEYRWRVRSKNSAGAGAWSALATLRRGWDGAVTGLAHVDEQVPTLRWDPIPDASFYEVEINLRPFLSPVYSRKTSFVCWTAQTTFTPYGVSVGSGTFDKAPGTMSSCTLGAASEAPVGKPLENLISGRTYYWRVRGRDATVDTTRTAFPDASAACLGPWLNSGIEVSDVGVVTVPLGETAPTAAGSPECSDWSQQGTFVPVAPDGQVSPAGTPTGLGVSPLAPGSGSRVVGNPTFSWDAVPHALFYRLYVSRDPKVGSLDFAASTQGTSLTPVTGLGLTSTTQYWAVQACTLVSNTPTDPTDPATQFDCGAISAAQEVSQVTTNPAAPRSLQAAPGYLLATWSTGSTRTAAARAYDVELTDTATGATKVVRTDRVSASVAGGTSSLVVPTAKMAQGDYTFRVRPVLENTRYTAWSARSGTAVLDHAAPTVRLAATAGFVNRTSVRLTFSEPVSNASASTVGVATGAGMKVPGTISRVSTTTVAFTPRAAWTTGGYFTAWTAGVVDRAGKPATAVASLVRAATTADSAGTAARWVTGDAPWVTRSASDAWLHGYRSTVDKSTTATRSHVTLPVYGTSVTIGYCRSPASGSMRVYVDGVLRTTVSQYRTWSGCGATAAVTGLRKGSHTVTVQAMAVGRRGTVTVDRISVG